MKKKTWKCTKTKDGTEVTFICDITKKDIQTTKKIPTTKKCIHIFSTNSTTALCGAKRKTQKKNNEKNNDPHNPLCVTCLTNAYTFWRNLGQLLCHLTETRTLAKDPQTPKTPGRLLLTRTTK